MAESIYINLSGEGSLSSGAGKLDTSLPNGQIFIGSAAGVATPQAVSGDATITNAGVVSVNTIANAVGTTLMNNATAGNVGEYASTGVSSFVPSSGAADIWSDTCSLVLTPGDWDVNYFHTVSRNGSSALTYFQVGISPSSGNSTSGLVQGSNWFHSNVVPSSANFQSVCIAGHRVQMGATAPIYGKTEVTFTSGLPLFACRLSARRVR